MCNEFLSALGVLMLFLSGVGTLIYVIWLLSEFSDMRKYLIEHNDKEHVHPILFQQLVDKVNNLENIVINNPASESCMPTKVQKRKRK